MADEPFIHPSSFVDAGAVVGAGSKVWHFCHVMGEAVIGEDCVLGQNVFVASGVTIGDRVHIQNNVSVYGGVTLEDDVFLGPSCVLTNVTNPRSQVNRKSLYESTLVRRGASVGANATIVCGHTIGRHAFIGAGALVNCDVADYQLMLGVPARPAGWMSRHGHRLVDRDGEGYLVCPESGLRYAERDDGTLECADLDADAPLPSDMAQGHQDYAHFKGKRGS